MKLNVFFIRHGLSCANITHYYKNTGVKDHDKYLDPELSNLGVKTSKEIGAKFRKKHIHLDGVLSSTLFRAIETAHHMFPNHAITPIPFVKEHDNELSDELMPWKDKINKFKKLYPKLKVNNHYLKGKDKNKTDYSKLKDFILEYAVSHFGYKKEYNIVIVCHSLYMWHNLPGLKINPLNNAIYKVVYTYKLDENPIVKIESGMKRKNELDKKEYKRCAKA